MTDKPTPKEIDLLVRTYLGDCGPQANRVYSFVTAVLAKWGQPAQAAEPADTVVLTAAQESLGVDFEKVLHDNLFDLYEESPHTARLEPARADTTQEDAALLDWLEQHDGRYYNLDKVAAIVGTGFLVQSEGNMPQVHSTLREAVGAARKQGEKQ